jgi:hypothetical protein
MKNNKKRFTKENKIKTNYYLIKPTDLRNVPFDPHLFVFLRRNMIRFCNTIAANNGATKRIPTRKISQEKKWVKTHLNLIKKHHVIGDNSVDSPKDESRKRKYLKEENLKEEYKKINH